MSLGTIFHRDLLTIELIELRFLRPNRHKIGQFWRRSSHPIPWLSTEKLKQTEQKQTCIRNKMYYNIDAHKQLKPSLVASYDLQPGKGVDR